MKYKLLYIYFISHILYSQQFRNITNISDLNGVLGNNGEAVEKTFTKLLKTNKSQTLWLQAIGVDEEGDIVSTFDFEWTLLRK